VETTRHTTTPAGHSFATTNWTVVLAASASPAERADALDSLCRAYWAPLYTYIRRRGHNLHEAQDLTQSFFAGLLSRNGLDRVSPSQGKFRSFLVASVNNFLANHRDWQQAAKRGGGQTILSLDEAAIEEGGVMKLAADDSPERALDRRWALTVLSRALGQLKADFISTGRESLFDRLKQFLEEEVRPGEYAGLASELGIAPGAVAVAVHRLRQRYRELIRREVARTVADPQEVETELGHLLKVLTT
jgi:RNA polymerase sigma-70 factor (ECF subfamily)